MKFYNETIKWLANSRHTNRKTNKIYCFYTAKLLPERRQWRI